MDDLVLFLGEREVQSHQSAAADTEVPPRVLYSLTFNKVDLASMSI